MEVALTLFGSLVALRQWHAEISALMVASPLLIYTLGNASLELYKAVTCDLEQTLLLEESVKRLLLWLLAYFTLYNLVIAEVPLPAVFLLTLAAYYLRKKRLKWY